MAQIRRPQARGVKSAFQNVAPATGGAFRVLAEVAETAYSRLAPAAVEMEMRPNGSMVGNDAIRQQVGENPIVTPTGSVSESLARTESGGDYSVVNSEGFTGKYQWGQARLDDYNRANGTALSLAEFRNSPQAQEAAQAWHEKDILANLGSYVGKTAGGITMTEGAIIGMAHLGGIGGARQFIESDGAYNPADSNGTSLADYARTHGGATSTGTYTPTMLRTADGKLESRLYSPFSGPILQAHNAAAGVAYQSGLMLKTTSDLMGLSQQFALDPEGFNQAAQSYMDDILKDVPDLFREDIRGTMQTEVQRRALGLLDERHRDIRQRADNTSRALVESQSNQLAAAIAGGDPQEIATARAQLEGTLTARESLPGASWTRAQSENALAAAENAGSATIKKAQDEQKKTYGNQLDAIIAGAKSGLTSAYEGILGDANIQALFPDKWREAAANVTLRDSLPSLGAGTPAQVAAAVADLAAVPVTDDFQAGIVNAAREFQSEHAKAFDVDPIGAAQKYLPEKPMPMPDLAATDPEGIGEWLRGRVDYGRKMVEEGYTDRMTMLSAEEEKAFGMVFSDDVPPDMKAEMAVAITTALGADAGEFFKHMEGVDRVVSYLGMLGAQGISMDVVKKGFMGSELLRTGQATKPTDATNIAQIDPGMAAAVMGLNGENARMMEAAFESAVAIAAAENPQTADPKSESATALMKKTLQTALGQTVTTGVTRGGVQPVAGKPTFLPTGVNGGDVDRALSTAFGTDAARPYSLGRFAPPTAPQDKPVDSTLWQRAGGGVPMLNNRPISSRHLSLAKIIPIGNTGRYMLSFDTPAGPVDARNAQGLPYTFDLQTLVDQDRLDRQQAAAQERADYYSKMETDLQVLIDAANAEVQVPQP